MSARYRLPPEPCHHCKAMFRPRVDLRKTGRGLYCSAKCSTSARSPDPTISPEEIARLYLDEMLGTKEIGAIAGTGWKRIARDLRAQGVTLRRPGWRPTKNYITAWGASGARTYAHVVAATEKYGRAPAKGEVVHHIDGTKQNNAPSNLVITSNSQHKKWHSQLERISLSLYRAGLLTFTETDGYALSERLAKLVAEDA